MNEVPAEKKGVFLSIRAKMLIPLILLFALVFSGAFYWFYTFSTQLVLNNIYTDLMSIARVAASGIDGDMHQALYVTADYDESQEWPQGMADERFWEIAEWLALVRKSNPRAFPYTYVSPEPGVVEFVVSAGAAEDPPAGAPFRYRYEPQPPSVILQGLEKETLSTNIVRDEYGAWVSGFVPIYDSSGQIVAAVGVDFRADDVIALQNRIKAAVIPAFAITGGVLLAAVLLISNGVTAPIRSLTNVAERIGEGRYETASIKPGFFYDEVTTLTRIFNIMVGKVREREERLKEQVARLRFEIDEAKRKKHVQEITDSEFFRELQEKARAIRARRGGKKAPGT
jgi:HAMP domain-containing protein